MRLLRKHVKLLSLVTNSRVVSLWNGLEYVSSWTRAGNWPSALSEVINGCMLCNYLASTRHTLFFHRPLFHKASAACPRVSTRPRHWQKTKGSTVLSYLRCFPDPSIGSFVRHEVTPSSRLRQEPLIETLESIKMQKRHISKDVVLYRGKPTPARCKMTGWQDRLWGWGFRRYDSGLIGFRTFYKTLKEDN